MVPVASTTPDELDGFSELVSRSRLLAQDWQELISAFSRFCNSSASWIGRLSGIVVIHIWYGKDTAKIVERGEVVTNQAEEVWESFVASIRERKFRGLAEADFQELCGQIRSEQQNNTQFVNHLKRCWMPKLATAVQRQYERRLAVCEEIERHFPWPSELAFKEARQQYENGTLMSWEQFSHELQRAE